MDPEIQCYYKLLAFSIIKFYSQPPDNQYHCNQHLVHAKYLLKWARVNKNNYYEIFISLQTYKQLSQISPLDIEINVNYKKIQCIPRSKHSVSVIKTSQLMLYR
jgi:hypothetical protein